MAIKMTTFIILFITYAIIGYAWVIITEWKEFGDEFKRMTMLGAFWPKAMYDKFKNWRKNRNE